MSEATRSSLLFLSVEIPSLALNLAALPTQDEPPNFAMTIFRLLPSILALATLVAATPAHAQKIAVIDMQECINQYHKTKTEIDKINEEAKTKTAPLDQIKQDMDNLANKLKPLEAKIQDTSLSMEVRKGAQAEAQALFAELGAKRKALEEQSSKLQAELYKMRQTMELTLVAEIRAVITKVAAAQAIDLVYDSSFLPKSNKAIVYIGPTVLDLTKNVVGTLNEGQPAPSPDSAPTASPPAAPKSAPAVP